jgi:hypothetical protein
VVNIGTIWSSEGKTVRNFCRLCYNDNMVYLSASWRLSLFLPTPAVEFLCGICDLSADRLKADAFAS